jgi:hypothetical protein
MTGIYEVRGDPGGDVPEFPDSLRGLLAAIEEATIGSLRGTGSREIVAIRPGGDQIIRIYTEGKQE